MGSRVMRFVICAGLLAGAAVAWQMLGDVDRRAEALATERAAVVSRLGRISELLYRIGAAQQSYLAPGQVDDSRVSSVLRDYYDETAAVGVQLRSPDAAAAMEALTAASRVLTAADTRARENLRAGQPLMAADVIVTDARGALDAMLATVRHLLSSELALQSGDAAAHGRERGRIVLWAGGIGAFALIVLALFPARPRAAEALEPVSLQAARSPEPVPSLSGVDLGSAAHLCVALSRLTAATELPPLLARAAGILDATGIILWMGAGEELFPVTAHGYKPGILARFGAIPRHAPNATAAAWREGRLRVVMGGASENGAIVVPLHGPETAIGVLSVEFGGNRETDVAIQAVASMIAAQLATAVNAWPAASTPVVFEPPERELRSANAS